MIPLGWLACAVPSAPPSDVVIVAVRAAGSPEGLEQRIVGPIEEAAGGHPRTRGLRSTVDGDRVVVEVTVDGPAQDVAVELRDRLVPELPGADLELGVRPGGETV